MPAKPNLFYTGVGSRQAPPDILCDLADYSQSLQNKGYTVRTGDAKGCDAIFARMNNSVIYDPTMVINKLDHWSYAEVKKYLPTDRQGFDNWKPYVKALLARNMMQVLGDAGNSPSGFLLCWAPSLFYEDSSSGGTGYAIRCALAHGITVYNLFDPVARLQFKTFLRALA